MIRRLASCAAIACWLFALMNDVNGYSPRSDVDLRLRFEGIAKFTDFDFYLKHATHDSTGKCESLHLILVQDGAFIHLKARGKRELGEVFLLAVPRGQKAEVPVGVDDKWLKTVPVGALQSTPLESSRNGPPLPGFPTVLVDLTYRVHIDGPNLEVVCIRRSDDFPWVGTLAIGAGVGAMALLVVYSVFRKRRAMAPRSE